jgi:hypothetical protein
MESEVHLSVLQQLLLLVVVVVDLMADLFHQVVVDPAALFPQVVAGVGVVDLFLQVEVEVEVEVKHPVTVAADPAALFPQVAAGVVVADLFLRVEVEHPGHGRLQQASVVLKQASALCSQAHL